MSWMIYGANGYTGVLVAERAIARGHRPVLAGRSKDKVKAVAERLGLPHVAFGLDDSSTVERELRGHDVVFAAAGPFAHTSEPLIAAALAAGVNYLDVTGEISVFQNTF